MDGSVPVDKDTSQSVGVQRGETGQTEFDTLPAEWFDLSSDDVSIILEEAAETLKEMGVPASADDVSDLFRALVEEEPEVGTDQRTEMLDAQVTFQEDFDTTSGLPDVRVVSNGDLEELENADVEMLPEGVLGAFVTEENSGVEGGIILVSDQLTEDGNSLGIMMEGVQREITLRDIIMEELGEAVGVQVQGIFEEMGSDLQVSEGDVGTRILKMSLGLELIASDYEAIEMADEDDNPVAGSDKVIVRYMNDSGEIVEGEAFAAGFSTIPLDEAQPMFEIGYDPSELTAESVTTLTNYLFNEAKDADGVVDVNGRDQVWGSGLFDAINVLQEGSITLPDIQDLYRFMNPGVGFTPGEQNTEMQTNFSWGQLKAAIEGGLIRFEATELGTDSNTGHSGTGYPSVTQAYVDFGQMTGYTDPHTEGAEPMRLGDYLVQVYREGNNEGELHGTQVEHMFKEFFGIDFDSTQRLGDTSRTLGEIWDANIATKAGEVSGRSITPDSNDIAQLLNGFLYDYGANPETSLYETSLIIYRDPHVVYDSGYAETNYQWATLNDAGTTRTQGVGGVGDTGAAEESADLTSEWGDYFEQFVDSFADFVNHPYMIPSSTDDPDLFAVDLQVDMLAISNKLYTAMRALVNMDEKLVQLSNQIANGYITEAEGEFAYEELVEKAGSMFNSAFSEDGEVVAFTDLVEVRAALEDKLALGMDNFTVYLGKATPMISKVADAYERAQVNKAIVAGLTMAMSVGPAYGSMALGKINLMNDNGLGVSASLGFLFGNLQNVSNNIMSFTDMYDLVEGGQLLSSGSPIFSDWQAMVDESESVDFQDSSVELGSAMYDYQNAQVAEDRYRIGWVGQTVADANGRLASLTVSGSETDRRNSYDDFAEYHRGLNELVAEANAASEGNITYYVEHPYDQDVFNGVTSDRWYDEGTMDIKAVYKPVDEAGTPPIEVYAFDFTQISNYETMQNKYGTYADEPDAAD